MPKKSAEKVVRTAPGRAWLNRTVLGIGLASLFSDLGHEAVTSILPAYLAGMGAAAGALGSVESFADGLSSGAKLLGGWLADRLKRVKPLCTSGYAVMALSPLVIAAASSWPLVACGRVLAWVSRGLRTPGRKVLLSEAVTPSTYGRAFGLERAMDTCGAILAPLSVLLLLRLGWTRRNIILLSALPAFAAALAIWLCVREREHPRGKARFLDSFKGFSAAFKRFLAGVGAFGLGDFADSFYILYAVQVLTPRLGGGAAASWSVAFYALHNAVYAALSYLSGGWSDRYPKRPILVAGYCLAASAALLMALGVDSLPGIAVVFVLGGLGVGASEAVEDSQAAALLPRERLGRGFGALAVTEGLGDWASSLGIGWLWAWLGPAPAFAAAAGLMFAGAFLMAILVGPNAALP